MFFALLIGLARIMAGVHFPIDILGGFIIGSLIAFLVKYLYSKFISDDNKTRLNKAILSGISNAILLRKSHYRPNIKKK